MQRLSWAIVVAAGLLALAWTSERLGGYILSGMTVTMFLGLLPFWSWLLTLVLVVLSFVRLWTIKSTANTPRFDVITEQRTHT